MSDLRTPPHSLEAERALLGSILLDANGRGEERVMDECRSEGVTEEAFYGPANRLVYATMLKMSMASKKRMVIAWPSSEMIIAIVSRICVRGW